MHVGRPGRGAFPLFYFSLNSAQKLLQHPLNPSQCLCVKNVDVALQGHGLVVDLAGLG